MVDENVCFNCTVVGNCWDNLNWFTVLHSCSCTGLQTGTGNTLNCTWREYGKDYFELERQQQSIRDRFYSGT